MIIDFSQNRDDVDISYVNDENRIEVEKIVLEKGYYSYVECDEFDPNRIQNLKSFKGSFVKSEPSKYFKNHNINEFFTKDLEKNHPEQHAKFSKLNIPKPYSVDIETEITDEFGYSNQYDTENRILSISFTDVNMESILFILENPKQPTFNEIDNQYIKNILKSSLGKYWKDYDFKTNIRVFKSEYEMLNTFMECVNKYFHLQIGWNFTTFDWLWIFNRSAKLGIDARKASPTFKLTKKSIRQKNGDQTEIKTPSHRIICDYMMLFKNSLVYNNLGSYSLNNIAGDILGLQKVMYDGNLRKLYDEDYNKFVAYAFIDTILVMLIHHAVNLLTIDFFQSYYTNVPYLKITQTAISEALIYQELREDNIVLLDSEHTVSNKRKYKGGFVKNPTKKLVNACLGEDYGSLYPNTMITAGLSPETKIDEIGVDTMGKPLTLIDKQKWKKYKGMGYCLTPTGRIYDITYDALFTRIEKKLLKQRNVFKGHASDIYLHIAPKIIAEIKRRKKLKDGN